MSKKVKLEVKKTVKTKKQEIKKLAVNTAFLNKTAVKDCASTDYKRNVHVNNLFALLKEIKLSQVNESQVESESLKKIKSIHASPKLALLTYEQAQSASAKLLGNEYSPKVDKNKFLYSLAYLYQGFASNYLKGTATTKKPFIFKSQAGFRPNSPYIIELTELGLLQKSE
jgi:hypothetical protein